MAFPFFSFFPFTFLSNHSFDITSTLAFCLCYLTGMTGRLKSMMVKVYQPVITVTTWRIMMFKSVEG